MKLYLSGPMSGIALMNSPAFDAAAARLRAAGHAVFNPADQGDGAGLGRTAQYRAFLPEDLRQVFAAEAVAVLPGWERSCGALIEVACAVAVGTPVLDAATLLPVGDLGLLAEDGTLTILGGETP